MNYLLLGFIFILTLCVYMYDMHLKWIFESNRNKKINYLMSDINWIYIEKKKWGNNRNKKVGKYIYIYIYVYI